MIGSISCVNNKSQLHFVTKIWHLIHDPFSNVHNFGYKSHKTIKIGTHHLQDIVYEYAKRHLSIMYNCWVCDTICVVTLWQHATVISTWTFTGQTLALPILKKWNFCAIWTNQLMPYAIFYPDWFIDIYSHRTRKFVEPPNNTWQTYVCSKSGFCFLSGCAPSMRIN